MTWIGKILTIFVMIASLIWMFLNVQTFVTATNWYAEAKKYREGFEKANKAREAEYAASQEAITSLTTERERYKDQVKTLTGQVDTLNLALGTSKAQYDKLNGDFETLTTEHKKSNSNLGAAREQVAQLRTQNDELEDKRVKLVREREQANTLKQQAINEKNAALSRVDQLTKVNEELQGTIYAMKQNGGKEPSALQRELAPKVAPLPENVRGTVLKVDREGGLVTLSIGLDAGLTPGAVLDLSRHSPEAKYLGKVKVTTIIDPKNAVAQFVPAASFRTLNQLRVDERPQVGDMVSLISR